MWGVFFHCLRSFLLLSFCFHTLCLLLSSHAFAPATPTINVGSVFHCLRSSYFFRSFFIPCAYYSPATPLHRPPPQPLQAPKWIVSRWTRPECGTHWRAWVIVCVCVSVWVIVCVWVCVCARLSTCMWVRGKDTAFRSSVNLCVYVCARMSTCIYVGERIGHCFRKQCALVCVCVCVHTHEYLYLCGREDRTCFR